MAISNRDLSVGTTLVGRYRGQEHRVLVVEDDAGTVAYEVDGGVTYSSLSAAASAVMGGISANGWRFWTEEGGQQVAATSEPKPARAPKQRAKKATALPAKDRFEQVRRMRRQEGCADGETRWFCSACMKGFCLPSQETPDACPAGHAREVRDDLAAPAD